MILEKIRQLSLREKRLLSIGIGILVVCSLYLFIVEPLQQKREQLETSIIQNQALLHWMEKSAPLLKQNRLTETVTLKNIPANSAISLIETSLKAANLDTALTQINKNNKNVVTLSFTDVNFDQFIAWLIHLAENYQISIVQTSIFTTQKQGFVTLTIKLQL